MSEPRKEVIAEGIELWLGDCEEVLPGIGSADHVIADPPYEKEAHRAGRQVKRGSHIVTAPLSFSAMGADRNSVAAETVRISRGWVILFCQVEGVAPWRDALVAAGAKYKAPMLWIKPDGKPQYNGQCPGIGFEAMVAAWAGEGKSCWNGGGRSGVFVVPKGGETRFGHETQKPINLMGQLVLLFSEPGDTILDPYMGSGSTGVAAVKYGRKFIGIEKDEKWFGLACRRIGKALVDGDMFVPPPPKHKDSTMFS